MLEFSTLTHLVTVLEMPTGDKEAATFYKQLTDMIAWKRQNPYAHFRNYKTYCRHTRLAMRRIGHLYPGLSQVSLAAPRVLALQGRDPRTLVGLEYLHTHISGQTNS